MPRLHLAEPVAAALVQPLRELIQAAAERLPPGPDLSVEIGDCPGFYSLSDRVLILSSGHLGPDMHHPLEGEGSLRLDRWRRAAAGILEGLVLLALAEASGRPPDLSDWRWVGAAVEITDEACPELQLGKSDLVRAAERGSPGQDPRQGVAVYRSQRRRGGDPFQAALSWIREEPAITAEQWLDAAAWASGAQLAAEVVVAVDVQAPVDVPVSSVPGWTWLRLDVPAHRRGGQVVAEGGAFVRDAWAPGGERLRTLAGALGQGGALSTALGGPVGTWENVSAHGFGQPFGVRGITWTLHPDGRLEMMLADAFVGPVEAVQMSESVGTSGVVPGRWAVAGERSLRFSQLVTSHLTLHGRDADPFVVPAGGALPQALLSLQEGRWSWRILGDELWLSGIMMGGPLEMRFRRSG